MAKSSDTALTAIFDEISRQAADARESFARNAEVAERIAAAVRGSGRLLLFGMGGSHAVNRVAEVAYRAAGIDATAIPVSEALNAPIPANGATVLLTSQSGESGEVVAYLARKNANETRFGLTLDPAGTLAKSVPSLVAHGGPEKAFAATRSLYVSLTMHARVLHALGLPHDRIVDSATRSEVAPLEVAIEKLAKVEAVFFSGRGAMQGIAEACALGLMELARMPSCALEGGQLRHGPVEALGSLLGVVFVRAADGPGLQPDSTAGLARVCVESESPTIVFDLSGTPPIEGATTVAFPACRGLEAALKVLPTLQRFLITVAAGRVMNVGQPIRSSKVTRET